MKTFKYIAIAAIAATMVSCDDFFDTDSVSAVSTSDVTDVQVQQLIAGIYNNFSENNSYRNRYYAIGMNTDIEYSNKSDVEPATKYNLSSGFSFLSNPEGKDLWGYLSRVVSNAASVIDNVEMNGDLENSVIRHYLGEAYFMRAFGTFEMLKLWGDIPIVESSLEVSSLKRDRNVAYELIRSDLSKAIAYLAWSDESPTPQTKTICRASKQAAFALRARVDMMYAGKSLRPNVWTGFKNSDCSVQYNVKDGVTVNFTEYNYSTKQFSTTSYQGVEARQKLYEEVVASCDSVITHDNVVITSYEYDEVFKTFCKENIKYGSNEFIFALPFMETRGQFLNYFSPKSKDANGELKHMTTTKNNASVQIVPTFVYEFDKADKRKWVTIAPFSWAADKGAGVSSNIETAKLAFPGFDGNTKILYQKKQNIEQFYLGKFRFEWTDRDIDVSNKGDDGIDIPIIRYADVLLMYAEACLGGISGDVPSNADLGKAQGYFDDIRKRAGLSSKTLSMENIQAERAFEFCGENIRKYDLERWGIFDEKMIQTQEDIKQLNLHSGKYADTGDEISFKYITDESLKAPKATVAHAYTIDYSTIYGLAHGENVIPAENTAENGWVTKNIFEKEEGGRPLASYALFKDQSKLVKQHYWPIWNNNISSSNGALWNDYDY